VALAGRLPEGRHAVRRPDLLESELDVPKQRVCNLNVALGIARPF